MCDKLAQIFAKQVLDTTMDFLYGLLLDGLGLADSLAETPEKEGLHKATGRHNTFNLKMHYVHNFFKMSCGM